MGQQKTPKKTVLKKMEERGKQKERLKEKKVKEVRQKHKREGKKKWQENNYL